MRAVLLFIIVNL